jgi:hypothetical protein
MVGIPKSFNIFASQSASLEAVERALNSDSVVDKAVTCCTLEPHDTGPPNTCRTYPVIDFL